MKKIFYSFIFIFSAMAFADAPPIVLESKKNYKLGPNLDILEDPTGKLTIHEVSGPLWKGKFKRNTEEVPSFGFSSSTVWARFKVQVKDPQTLWILSHHYYFQDEIVFYKKAKGLWEESKTGDLFPFSSREVKTRSFSFRFKPVNGFYFVKIRGFYNKFDLTLKSQGRALLDEAEKNLIIGPFLGLFLTVIIITLFIIFSSRSKTYSFYLIYILSSVTILLLSLGYGQKYLFRDIFWMNNNGILFLIGLSILSFMFFSIRFLKLNDSSKVLLKSIKTFCVASLLILISSSFLPYSVNLKLIPVMVFFGLFFGLLSGIYRLKEKYESSIYYVFSLTFFSLGIILWFFVERGLVSENMFTTHSLLIGYAIQLIVISMGLASRVQSVKLNTYKNIKESLEIQQNYTRDLIYETEEKSKKIKNQNKKLKERSNMIENLLDNIKTSVFAVGPDFKILPPVSKYSKIIFKRDIVGEKVSDVLFPNIRKGTREYGDLGFFFDVVFGEDALQFEALKQALPERVILNDFSLAKEIILKLSYDPFLDTKNVVEKIMCTAEDITESEEQINQAKIDQMNFQITSEIFSFDGTEAVSKKMEDYIKKAYEILDDFVSPLSDTYEFEYFETKMKSYSFETDDIVNLKHLPILNKIFNEYVFEIEAFRDKKEVNHQIEATLIICDLIEKMLRYASNISNFTRVNFNDYSLKKSVVEKVKDIENIFKNLFEYVFLVRDINNIDEEKLKKVVQVGKLYPNFERTINLIQQRSRFTSFLFKLILEEDLSLAYDKLSKKVKQMPDRHRLNEHIVKNNLIEPYKEVLEKTANIEHDLSQRIEERKKEEVDDSGYIALLKGLLERLVEESQEGPSPGLPPLTPINKKMVGYLRGLVLVMEDILKSSDVKKEIIEKNILSAEEVIRINLQKELSFAKALSFDRRSKNLIKFLRKNTPEKKESS